MHDEQSISPSIFYRQPCFPVESAHLEPEHPGTCKAVPNQLLHSKQVADLQERYPKKLN